MTEEHYTLEDFDYDLPHAAYPKLSFQIRLICSA